MVLINTDPLKLLQQKYGFDPEDIEEAVSGNKYSAIMLKNGQIGVCANLFRKVNIDKNHLIELDLAKMEDRIIINAYFNAKFNYKIVHPGSADILKAVDFSQYSNIVMVGLFRPILYKMQQVGLDVKVFDKNQSSEQLLPIEELGLNLKKADVVILTATSIFNKSFYDIVAGTTLNCKIFILGPSSILDYELFQYKNISMIFGAVFPLYENRVMEIIAKGGGTRKFLKLGKKIFIKRDTLK